MYVDQHQRDWDDQLPYCLFAIRSVVQDTMHEMPHYLLFGCDPMLPIDVALRYQPSPYVAIEDQPFPNQVANRLTSAWHAAETHHRAAQGHQKRQYDAKAQAPEIRIGDLVFLYNPVVLGRAAKLGKPWVGPYHITELHGTTVRLQTLANNLPKPVTVHINRLKLYHVTETDSQPLANIDKQSRKVQLQPKPTNMDGLTPAADSAEVMPNPLGTDTPKLQSTTDMVDGTTGADAPAATQPQLWYNL